MPYDHVECLFENPRLDLYAQGQWGIEAERPNLQRVEASHCEGTKLQDLRINQGLKISRSLGVVSSYYRRAPVV